MPLVIKYRETQAKKIVEELGKLIQQRNERETPTLQNPEIFRERYLLLYDFYHRFFLDDMRAIYPLKDEDSRKSKVDNWREKNPERLSYTAFIKIIEYFTRFCRTKDNRERNIFYDKVRLVLESYAKTLPLTISPKLAHIGKWMHDNINAKENLQYVVSDFPAPEQTYLNPKYNSKPAY